MLGTLRKASDFSSLLSLPLPQRELAYRTLTTEFLMGWIKNAKNFHSILSPLTQKQRIPFYQGLIDQKLLAPLPKFIHCALDFYHVMVHLTPEQRVPLCQTLYQYLPPFIRSAVSFYRVMIFLPIEQKIPLYKSFKKRLPSFIKNARDFYHVMEPLTLQQRNPIYEALAQRLPGFIKNAQDFHFVMGPLAPQHRVPVYQAKIEYISKKIENPRDLHLALEYLTEKQRILLYEAVQPSLQKLKEGTANDFYKLLKYLTEQQRDFVYKTSQRQLVDSIQTVEELWKILAFLLPKQRLSIFAAIQPRLKELLLESVADFHTLLSCLEPTQRSISFHAFLPELNYLIRNTEDFLKAAEFLSLEQQSILYIDAQARLPSFIQNAQDLYQVLNVVPPEHSNAFCQAVFAQNVTLIHNRTEWNTAFNRPWQIPRAIRALLFGIMPQESPSLKLILLMMFLGFSFCAYFGLSLIATFLTCTLVGLGTYFFSKKVIAHRHMELQKRIEGTIPFQKDTIPFTIGKYSAQNTFKGFCWYFSSYCLFTERQNTAFYDGYLTSCSLKGLNSPSIRNRK